MKPVFFSKRAAQDLREIAGYIRKESPASAKAFSAQLRQRCAKFGSLPLAARRLRAAGHDLRIAPFRSYVIIYRAGDDKITVERIWHGSRNIPVLISDNFPES